MGPVAMHNFQLNRNSFGRLVLTDEEGTVYQDIVPVHAFPISAPSEGIALVSADGHELAWIAHMTDVTENTRKLIEEELASREFIPEIHQIRQVSTFATPSIWNIETNRGSTQFILKSEDDIRRLNHTTLLIADSNGIHYLIRDTQQLDKHSHKLLDRFL
jgi:Domain of unknown function (DUF1854)